MVAGRWSLVVGGWLVEAASPPLLPMSCSFFIAGGWWSVAERSRSRMAGVVMPPEGWEKQAS